MFFLLGILFYSCSDEGAVEQSKMIRIYTDLLLAQDSSVTASSLKTGYGKEALPDSVKSSIFRKYNVSAEDYEKTIEYYNEEQEHWETFFNKTIDYLDSLKSKSAK